MGKELKEAYGDELDQWGNPVREIYVLIDFCGDNALFVFYGTDHGAKHWYYSRIDRIDQDLRKAVDVGNHKLIVDWMKARWDDMQHKRVTFEKGPGIRYIFGRGRHKYNDQEY